MILHICTRSGNNGDCAQEINSCIVFGYRCIDMRENKRLLTSFILLAIMLVLLFVLNVAFGSRAVAIADIPAILMGSGGGTAHSIIWSIRLPRIVTAMILGGALAVSGFLLQTFFNNPIAGPFILGISSGSKLAVALVMIFSLGAGMHLGSFAMVLAAFAGAMAVTGFILAASQQVHRMSVLIICGVMVGYICSAITEIVVTFADDSNIVNLHNWSLGTFSGSTWSDVASAGAVVALAVTAAFLLSKPVASAGTVVALAVTTAFLLSKPIGAYQLGESAAGSLGVNVLRLRIAVILLSSVLSAVVTAFAGPVSFVGVAVPHLIRNLMKTQRPIVMIPACFLGGAVFCLFSDLIARTLFAPTELSISTVTAVFGAPCVIWIMMTRNRRRSSPDSGSGFCDIRLIIEGKKEVDMNCKLASLYICVKDMERAVRSL